MAISAVVTDRLRVSWQGHADWFTNAAVINNPAGGAVLQDTTALSAGSYLFHVIGWSDTATAYEIEHRNAANAATLHRVRRAIPANSNDDQIFGSKLNVAEGERLRVTMVAPLVGNCDCAILVQEVVRTEVT